MEHEAPGRCVCGQRPAAVALGVLLTALASVSTARAVDVGQISVIEDTTGRMLPALGICSNILYPNALCIPPAGQAFFETHPDSYDILVFMTNKALLATEKAGYPLKADVRGIGQDTVPWNYAHFGSSGRLIHALNMGSVQSWPDDPDGTFSAIPISGLEVFGHEIGHHWMAYANIDLDDGRGELDIIRGYRDGGAITHWSCRFNSSSVMYGGMLTENGDGTFTDVNGPRGYTHLDQYLMGLRRPDEVDPMWYVADGGSLHGCADWPEAPGIAHDITGTRVDFDMDDVIRALGARDPATSPCHYKVGFVFVHRPGEFPSTLDLEKVELYRTELESWYAAATDDRGSLDTRLDGCGTGTTTCPGEPSPHCGAAPDEEAEDVHESSEDVGSEDAGILDAWSDGEDGWNEDPVIDPGVDAPPGTDDGIGSCGCLLVR